MADGPRIGALALGLQSLDSVEYKRVQWVAYIHPISGCMYQKVEWVSKRGSVCRQFLLMTFLEKMPLR